MWTSPGFCDERGVHPAVARDHQGRASRFQTRPRKCCRQCSVRPKISLTDIRTSYRSTAGFGYIIRHVDLRRHDRGGRRLAEGSLLFRRCRAISGHRASGQKWRD
jgi:hypothetical protein